MLSELARAPVPGKLALEYAGVQVLYSSSHLLNLGHEDVVDRVLHAVPVQDPAMHWCNGPHAFLHYVATPLESTAAHT